MTETISAPFLGDHLALDFLNTLFVVGGKTIDSIDTPAKLAVWLNSARDRHRGAFSAMQRLTDKSVTPTVVAAARELRARLLEVLRRIGMDHRPGLRAGELKTLNRILAAGRRHWILVAGQDRPTLREAIRVDNPVAVLLPVAQAVAELLCHDDLSRVRKCGNHACVLRFYDRTKSKRRRWCSMQVCGNQAKINAFRQRRRTAKRSHRGRARG